MDVTDLLLENTDHAQPACDRTQLVEQWKQRTPELLEFPHCSSCDEKQKGYYATNRLR